jgi:heme exporter protein C
MFAKLSSMMHKYWWKILTVILLLYVGSYGFLVQVPNPPGVPLQQSIRNLFFHVPMWIGMMILLGISVVYAILYLRNPSVKNDIYSTAYATTGTTFGFLGIVTGALWANYQWGQPWSGDPKQNGAAIAILIYLAYFVLRGSMTDDEKRARISAVFNIFAFFMLFPTLWILPRLTQSLHPGGQGSEGNPGLNPKDSTMAMRSVMYPAFIGWTLLGVWVTTLKIRTQLLTEKYLTNE